jgi:WD40 repeat protein
MRQVTLRKAVLSTFFLFGNALAGCSGYAPALPGGVAPPPHRTIELAEGGHRLALSRDGLLAVIGNDGLNFIDLNTNECHAVRSPFVVHYVAISPNGETALALGGVSDQIKLEVWDANKHVVRNLFDIGPGHPESIALEDSARFAYIGTSNGRVLCVNLESGAVREVFGPRSSPRFPADPIRFFDGLAIVPGEDKLVIGCAEGVIIWDLKASSEVLFLPQRARGIAVSTKANQVAVASTDGITVVDLRNGKTIHSHPHVIDGGELDTLAFSSDGEYLAAGLNMGLREPSYLLVWRTSNYAVVKSFTSHKDVFLGLQFIDGSHKLVTSSSDKTVRVWDIDALGLTSPTENNKSK